MGCYSSEMHVDRRYLGQEMRTFRTDSSHVRSSFHRTTSCRSLRLLDDPS